MIKNTLNIIIIASVFFTLLSCAKEKKEVQPEAEQTIQVKDTAAAPLQPQAVLPAPNMNKDTIAKYSPISDAKASGCEILRKGTFTYNDTDGDMVTVKIVDGAITEEHKGGKYVIVSQMKWINDCEYDNMLILSTVPKVKLEPGTVMNVVIDKVEGDNIYFTATAKGKSYHNMLTKIK